MANLRGNYRLAIHAVSLSHISTHTHTQIHSSFYRNFLSPLLPISKLWSIGRGDEGVEKGELGREGGGIKYGSRGLAIIAGFCLLTPAACLASLAEVYN